jgi:elongation factor P
MGGIGWVTAGGSKLAVMETGLSVQVPLFINNGDLLDINTNEGSYLKRNTDSA